MAIGIYPRKNAASQQTSFFHNGFVQKKNATRTQSYTDNGTFLFNVPNASVACSQIFFPDKSSYIRKKTLRQAVFGRKG